MNASNWSFPNGNRAVTTVLVVAKGPRMLMLCRLDLDGLALLIFNLRSRWRRGARDRGQGRRALKVVRQ